MKKILLVEDNRDISQNIKDYLEMEGYDITQCFHGEDALDTSLQNNFDLILLDLMLPGIDGIRICEKVKSRKEVPIIMITARDSIDDRVLGLETGADDYLVKPFDLRELHARVNSVMRKYVSKDVIIREDLFIDMKKRVFQKAGEDVNITQKEFLILEMLIGKNGLLVDRTELIEYIWGEDALFDGDNKLDVYISTLRKKLGKRFIKTVKGVGYKI